MKIITHKKLAIVVLALAIMILVSCDLRSGIAKDEEEKLNGTPAPSVSPTPTAVPIDPADVIQVDTSQSGDGLIVNGRQQNKTAACIKYNDVNINIESAVVTITGACRQITINGDNNRITADATMRFVVNGDGNNIGYLKFPNGQRPSVTDNGSGNVIEKVVTDALANTPPKRKSVK